MHKLLAYLALGFAISATDVSPKATASIPVASVSFSSTGFYVQTASAVNDAKATTIKLPITTTQGNALVVMVTWDSNVTATLTDKLSNTFTKNQTDYSTSIAQGQATFSSIGIKGGADTLTATFGNSRPFRRIVAIEYTSVTGVDTSAKAQATANPVTVPIVTRNAGDILVCAIEPSNDSVTIPTFNKRPVTHSEFQVFDTLVNTIGSHPCAGSISVSEAWTGQVIALTTNSSNGSLPQNVTVRWHPSHINPPDSMTWYYLEYTKDGWSVVHPPGGSNITSGSLSVPTSSKDTLDSATFYYVDPPTPGKTADYLIMVYGISSRQIDSLHVAGSRPAVYLYRRTNNSIAQLPLDSVAISIRMVVPPSFGIFGDSFRLYRKVYTDTNSINNTPIQYIGTAFPRNSTFTPPKQLKTYRYSYYISPFILGQVIDTIYIGTLEMTNP